MTVDDIDEAIRIMREITTKANGQNWLTVYEKFPDDTAFIGVEDADDEGLMILESHDDVSENDGEFISMMDPAMAYFLIDFLENIREGMRQEKGPLRGRTLAWRITRHVVTKFGKGQ